METQLTTKERKLILQSTKMYASYLQQRIEEIEAVNTLHIGQLQRSRFALVKRLENELCICKDVRKKMHTAYERSGL